jgi:hypothetical protein
VALKRTSLIADRRIDRCSRSVDSLRRAALARRRRCLTHVDRSGRASDAPSPCRSRARRLFVDPTEIRFHRHPREGVTTTGIRDAFARQETPKGSTSARALAHASAGRLRFARAFTLAEAAIRFGLAPSLLAAKHRLTSSATCHDPRTHSASCRPPIREGYRAERAPEGVSGRGHRLEARPIFG